MPESPATTSFGQMCDPATPNKERIQDSPGYLPWWHAIGHAFASPFSDRYRKIDYYPLVRASETDDPLPGKTDAIMDGIVPEIGSWPATLDQKQLEIALNLARESLDEVKELTEYQDQKATRLLTVMSFVLALSGALFAKFGDAYPLRASVQNAEYWQSALVLASYGLFGLFILAAASGALVTFHATRWRFKYPKPAVGREGRKGDPNSMIFAVPIIEVMPKSWVRAFISDAAAEPAPNSGSPTGEAITSRLLARLESLLQTDKAKPESDNGLSIRADLQMRYLKSYVTEAYLVGAKAADKLRYLEPAQQLLSMALSFLLPWIVTIAAVAALVPSTKPSGSVVPVSLQPSSAPITISPPLDPVMTPSPPFNSTPPALLIWGQPGIGLADVRGVTTNTGGEVSKDGARLGEGR